MSLRNISSDCPKLIELLLITKSFVSSANVVTEHQFLLFIISVILLIYNRNSIGSNAIPWGISKINVTL